MGGVQWGDLRGDADGAGKRRAEELWVAEDEREPAALQLHAVDLLREREGEELQIERGRGRGRRRDGRANEEG
jgi:hypothetical protein